jgi:hypothetical protein
MPHVCAELPGKDVTLTTKAADTGFPLTRRKKLPPQARKKLAGHVGVSRVTRPPANALLIAHVGGGLVAILVTCGTK